MAQDLDVLLASGKGAVSGAGQGAMIGSNPALMAATGGLSAPVATGLGALLGGVSSGLKQNKANQSQQIPFIDPIESRRLSEIEQARKSLMTGSDALTQRRIDEARNIGSAVQGAITRSTAGDVGSTMDVLLKSQKNTQSAINQGISESQSRLPYFDNASTMLAQRIAQRKLELGLLNRSQSMAENAQSRKEANLNSNALLGVQGGTATPNDALQMLLNLIAQKQTGVQGTNTDSSLSVTPGDTEIGTNNFMNFMGGLQSSGLIQ